MYNLTHVLKTGEVGETIQFTLRDDDGVVDLTNFTVTMNLERNGEIVVDDAAVTKKDQTTDTGECFHTWDSTTAALGKGTYRGNLKLTYGSSVLYWPKDKNGKRTYFEVIVQEPID